VGLPATIGAKQPPLAASQTPAQPAPSKVEGPPASARTVKPATPVGTTGTAIERDKLDEIRAEVQQLKVILKR